MSEKWQGVYMVAWMVLEFTLGDFIGWLWVITIFLLLFALIYFLIKRARSRNGGGNTVTILLAQIAVLDERIRQLQKEIDDLKRQREQIKQQARGYAELQREIDAVSLIDATPEVPPSIKVLMVVPSTNLPLANAETQDVQRSGLEVTPVYSPVGLVTFTREVLASNHDGLWMAGHMDSAGNFLLDGGEMISPSALTSLVRGRFQWVFLNSCQSIFAAQGLQNETDADVICTVIDVPDIDAYRTGSLFANWLARLGDIRAAYEQSRPGANRIYLYLSSARPRIIVAKK